MNMWRLLWLKDIAFKMGLVGLDNLSESALALKMIPNQLIVSKYMKSIFSRAGGRYRDLVQTSKRALPRLLSGTIIWTRCRPSWSGMMQKFAT